MPTTISVSPAVPDKLVVNGVDLLNRDELSHSQQRELQRYIDANAHLLGFLDKEKEEREAAEKAASRYSGPLPAVESSLPPAKAYNSFSLDRAPVRSFDDSSSTAYARPPSTTQSLTRAMDTGSPYSDYGGPGKRKGVSWSDVVVPDGQQLSPEQMGRARSNSPSQNNSFYRNSGDFSDSMATWDPSRGDYRHAKMARGRSPPYSTIDKQRTPYEQDSVWSPSPYDSGSWMRQNRQGSGNEREKQGWRGFAKPDLPTYSALERKADDFNPFQTHIHREEAIGLRKSQERDDAIKFYGYGDHRVSGIEMQPRRWQGGEIVTDPLFIKKSLKPRRLFYSPIGDGVVEADGIEMKRPPPDLTPRRYVYHQRVVEQDPGQPGLKVIENVWHEGGEGDGLGDGRGAGEGPGTPGEGLGGGGGKGPGSDDGMDRDKGDQRPKKPADDGRGRKGPAEADWPRAEEGAALGKFPLLEDGLGRGRPAGPEDDGLGTRPESAAPSIASGAPREPWQITFIANPRECINIFGTEVNTNIFDLEDHTPKTITTIKETFSPARDLPPPEQEENQ